MLWLSICLDLSMGKIHSRQQAGAIKAAPIKHSYTQRQFAEIFRCHCDPQYFIDNYLKFKNSAHGLTPFKFLTRPYQQTQLRTMQSNSVFCLQPRNSGSTALPLAFQLWSAIFHPKTRHGAAFIANILAVNGLSLIRHWYDSLPQWLRPDLTYMSNQRLEFDNGSSITAGLICANFNNGRAWNTLYVDCLSLADERDQENFWLSAATVLSGRVFLTGTPNSLTDTFAKIWHGLMKQPNSHFMTMQIPVGLIYSQSEQDNLRQLVGDRTFRREYNCEFIP